MAGIHQLDTTEWVTYIEQKSSSLEDDLDVTDTVVFCCIALAAPLTAGVKAEVKARAFALCGELS